jgi:DNA-directed RNA polymerase II subunit RPB2
MYEDPNAAGASLLTESLTRAFVGSCFADRGYASVAIESFNHFVETDLPHIVDEHSRLNCVVNGIKHDLRFHSVTMGAPSHKGIEGTVYPTTPHLCRMSRLTYHSQVFVSVTHTVSREAKPDEVRTFVNVPLCYLPVMVGSSVDVSASAAAPKNHECVMDEGGWFVIGGNEKVVQPQERLAYNQDFVFSGKKGITAEVRSVYESKLRSSNTTYATMSARKAGATPELSFQIQYLSTTVPLVVVFRLLGVSEVPDMLRLVFPAAPPDDASPPVRLLQEVLRHEAGLLPMERLYEWLCPEGADAAARAVMVQRLIDNEFLQHLGVKESASTSLKKAAYVGLLVRRLLAVHFRKAHADDRDDYGNKRVATVGMQLGVLFRQLMRKFHKTLGRVLMKTVQAERYVNIAEMIAARSMTSDLSYAFTTGNWSAQRSTGTQMPVTQLVNRMSHLSLASAVGRVDTKACREGMSEMRQLHTSTYGIFCPSETPEGGSCGLIKNLAMLAYVRTGTPTPLLEAALLSEFGVEPWSGGSAEEEAAGGVQEAAGSMVLVNGVIVGYTQDADALAQALREARRDGALSFDTSVVRTLDGVKLHSDAGCVMRPLFVASRLHLLPGVLAAAGASGDTPHLWRAALACGVIEYVDKSEEQSCARVATRPEELLAEDGGVFSHAEIHPTAIFGLVGALTPFSDRNQAPRNMYQAAMGKQSVCVPALNFRERFDNSAHAPWYVQKPLVRTFMEDVLGTAEVPAGVNMTVAVLAYSGYNQDDSLVLSQRFADLGGGRSTCYKVEKDQAGVGMDCETFEHPYLVNATGLQHAEYKKLDAADGTVHPGDVVYPGDVLIGKTLSTVELDEGAAAGRRHTTKVDHSLVYRGREPAVVDSIALSTNRDGALSKKVKLRSQRLPRVGDKFCLTSDHDVLTMSRGWVGIKEVLESDLVAQLSQDRRSLEFVRPLERLEFLHLEEDLIEIESPRVSQRVTLNHRVWVRLPGRAAPELVEASQLLGAGSFHMQTGGAPVVLPVREEDPPPLDITLLDAAESRYRVLQLFGRDGGTYWTGSRVNRDDVQCLVQRAGYSASVAWHKEDSAPGWGASGGPPASRHSYTLTLHQAAEAEVLPAHVRLHKAPVLTDGRVYCLRVPSEVFLVRRRGRCSFTGNSSRHGQKGTVGLMMRPEDMPFVEGGPNAGMIPDVIVNPNAMTSRMTIGMLMEGLCAKAGCMLGKLQDGTAFQREVTADTVGAALHAAGGERYGNERMRNGMTGELLEASVFFVPVFYQKLKHMVADKLHARSRGPVNPLTQQPLEGRSREGALRFGEMERDCGIAHGAAKFVHNRLVRSSAPCIAPVCGKCGLLAEHAHDPAFGASVVGKRPYCRSCDTHEGVQLVEIPFAMKLLTQELNAVSIAMRYELEPLQ